MTLWLQLFRQALSMAWIRCSHCIFKICIFKITKNFISSWKTFSKFERSSNIISSNLRSLFLSDNKLTFLPDNVFNGLSSIEALHFKNNLLESLPEAIFRDLNSLRSLTLSNNNLTTLYRAHFQDLINLYSLDLEENRISYLDENIFDSPLCLKFLKISSNPIENDVQIVENSDECFSIRYRNKPTTTQTTTTTSETTTSEIDQISFTTTAAYTDYYMENELAQNSTPLSFATHVNKIQISFSSLKESVLIILVISIILVIIAFVMNRCLCI